MVEANYEAAGQDMMLGDQTQQIDNPDVYNAKE